VCSCFAAGVCARNSVALVLEFGCIITLLSVVGGQFSFRVLEELSSVFASNSERLVATQF